MFDPALAAFLESGCALIIGTVGDDGEPYATRGWGLTVLPEGERRLRLLLDAEDDVTLQHLGGGGRVAITAGEVSTLRSLQMKGRASEVCDANDDDRARARRYCDDFFDSILRADGTARELTERLVPADFAACVVEIDEMYDQTPGPGAGARLPAGPP